MWQVFYIRARELHDERRRSAELERIAREVPAPPHGRGQGRGTPVRLAVVAAALWVARRARQTPTSRGGVRSARPADSP